MPREKPFERGRSKGEETLKVVLTKLEGEFYWDKLQ
jgi:hypothetical protein